MQYKEAMAYIKDTTKYGIVPGLTNITILEEKLGNPQDKIKTVHVAGTNGKGSTIAFLTSILRCAGYSVGTYISPAVNGYRERFQINGKNISKDELAEVTDIVKKEADAMMEEGFTHPTVFEIETAMAFVYFEKSDCDIAIIETGMGGTLDATNTIKQPLCSIITSVSLDHTAVLGNSLLEVASTKAGIIKENSPVVVSNQSTVVLDVVSAKASVCKSDVYVTNPVMYDEEGKYFSYLSRQGVTFKKLRTSLLGLFQGGNAANAIEAALLLKNMGYDITSSDIKDGLKKAKWKCRMEKISDWPEFYIDGAHNPAAAKALGQTLEMYFTNRKFVFIIGVLADKDYEQIARLLAPKAQCIFAITPGNSRALPAEELCDTLKKYNNSVVVAADIKDAVLSAIDKALELMPQAEALGMECVSDVNDEPVIVAFGSLSYLNTLKKTVKAVRRD